MGTPRDVAKIMVSIPHLESGLPESLLKGPILRGGYAKAEREGARAANAGDPPPFRDLQPARLSRFQ